jgi:hypothetical protein
MTCFWPCYIIHSRLKVCFWKFYVMLILRVFHWCCGGYSFLFIHSMEIRCSCKCILTWPNAVYSMTALSDWLMTIFWNDHCVQVFDILLIRYWWHSILFHSPYGILCDDDDTSDDEYPSIFIIRYFCLIFSVKREMLMMMIFCHYFSDDDITIVFKW